MLDTKKEHIAVTEANKLGIPVVAVVDTNVDPELVQYPIPGNDDAIRANSLLARVIADAVEEGRFIAAKRDPATPPSSRIGRGRGRVHGPQTEARNAAARAQAERDARLAAARDGHARSPSRPRLRPGPARRARRRRRRAAEPLQPSVAADRGAPTPSRRRGHRRRRDRRHADTRQPRTRRADRDGVHRQGRPGAARATGAGMMDAKKALEANDGDMEAAKSGCASRASPPAPSATTATTPRASSAS